MVCPRGYASQYQCHLTSSITDSQSLYVIAKSICKAGNIFCVRGFFSIFVLMLLSEIHTNWQIGSYYDSVEIMSFLILPKIGQQIAKILV